jgi:SAM-dependent methyltransferase
VNSSQGRPTVHDARLYAPAVQRNRDIILASLRSILPARGLVLEVASGSGEHIAHLASALDNLIFQPSDQDATAIASIDAWVMHSGLTNVRPAIVLDAALDPWPVASADAVLCINMIHISPWAATVGLFRNAARVLPPGGVMVLYGPFDRAGVPLAPSNAAFDAALRARDPAWGLRRLEDLSDLAAGFAAPEIIEVPANNLVVIYRRQPAPVGVDGSKDGKAR